MTNTLGSLESYFAIHSDLSKNLSNQINTDIIPSLLDYIKNEKELIKNLELSGKESEKNLMEEMQSYDKVRKININDK